MPQKHEIWGPLPTAVSSILHLKLQMLESETPPEALCLQLQKASLVCSHLKKTGLWDNMNHGLNSQKHTVISAALTQSKSSEGDSGQEEAVIKVPPRAAVTAVPTLTSVKKGRSSPGHPPPSHYHVSSLLLHQLSIFNTLLLEHIDPHHG